VFRLTFIECMMLVALTAYITAGGVKYVHSKQVAVAAEMPLEEVPMSAIECVDTYVYKAKVVRWIDGDTVELAVDLGFGIWKNDRFRLLDVNTPERGKERFDESVQIVNEYAPVGSTVIVWSHKTEKYGRWLAVIYNMKEAEKRSLAKSINEILREKGWIYQ